MTQAKLPAPNLAVSTRARLAPHANALNANRIVANLVRCNFSVRSSQLTNLDSGPILTRVNKNRMARLLLLLFAVSPCFLGTLQGQCLTSKNSPKTETFSGVEKLPDVPGPAGIEITLEENGQNVRATLRDYEGISAPLIGKLQGTMTDSQNGCEVTLVGRNRREKIEIHGVIRSAEFEATITRESKTQRYVEPVSLKRKLPSVTDQVG
jgi:hypothetical protein